VRRLACRTGRDVTPAPAATLEPWRPANPKLPGDNVNDPQATEPAEPENPAAWALARHIADHPVSTIQAAFRYLNAPVEIELHEPSASPPSADQPALREQLSARLWEVAEDRIVAEWICCEPLDPSHDLCAKGYATLEMVKTLLVDDPEAWNPNAPLLDAILAVLPPPTDRAAALTEAERTMLAYALDQAQERIWSEDGFTDDDQAAVTSLRRLAAETQPDCDGCGHAPHLADQCQGFTFNERCECDEPVAAGTAAPDTQDEAHPPHHRWYVETRDGLVDQWAPGMRFTERDAAVERYQVVSEHHPLWKDGTPVERRLVRETTSYTVEQPAVVAAVAGEEPALRCVCGDPVELRDEIDPSSWIHSPGSETPCLNARPRCSHCQMPHDLNPDSGAPAACTSVLASIRDRDGATDTRAPRSDVGTEFVHQADNPDQAALDLWETDLAQSGVDTPGCDCGHDGMGVRWHDTACAWKVGLVAEARAAVSQPGKEPRP
jgi:hypothetical protein